MLQRRSMEENDVPHVPDPPQSPAVVKRAASTVAKAKPQPPRAAQPAAKPAPKPAEPEPAQAEADEEESVFGIFGWD